MNPLVSCIMPTRNRRQYIAGAVACYNAQTWDNRELVVVDNSDEPVSDLIPPTARYEYLGNAHKTVGWMRNRACELAQGEYIAHWDDDDYSFPRRITEQYKLQRSHEAALVGYRSMSFLDEDRGEAWLYSGEKGFALGTSFFYPRNLWRSQKFADLQVCEDGDMLRRAGGAISVEAGHRMVARIHSGNTSPKRSIIHPGTFWKRMDYAQVAQWIGS